MKEIYLNLAENIKSSLHTQSLIGLKLDVDGKIDRQLYDKEDMMNVSLLFMHIMGNIAANYCMSEKGMTPEEAGKIATELGNNMRQTILLGTGIDTHEK